MMTSEEQALVKSCVAVLDALCERRQTPPVESAEGSDPDLKALVRQVNRLAAPDTGTMIDIIRRAGKLCHEINQPLTAISGYSELLMMEIDPEDPIRDRLEKIRSQVERLGDTTTELMQLLRGVYEDDNSD